MKGTQKYYCLFALCGILISILFLTSTLNMSLKRSQEKSISFAQKDIKSNLASYNTSISLNNFSQKIYSQNHKFIIRKRKQQRKLSLIVELDSKIIDLNFSNTLQKEHSKPKLIDKSNHCCFLI